MKQAQNTMEGPNAAASTTADYKLNDLPEELLLRILSSLPTIDTVQTSLISQKWRPLWSRVPSLNFPFELFPPSAVPSETRQKFSDVIDRVLISRSFSNSPIHTFRLSFPYHHHYRSHVDSWIRSAVSRLRARELHLDFLFARMYISPADDEHKYDFPLTLLKNGSVEFLRLTRCDVTFPANISSPTAATPFRSIVSVCLGIIDLTDGTIPGLIAGCPNLESLELRVCVCRGFRRLKICSRRLKSLVICHFYITEMKESVLVDCPNLHFISFEYTDFDRYVLKNAGALVEFRGRKRIELSYPHWRKVAALLDQAPNVERLYLENYWFKFLKSEDSFPKCFMFHNLNLLEMQTGFTPYDLVGMAALLKLCPNLETMILGSFFKFEEDESLPEELLDKPIDLSMPSRLKQVTLKDYSGSEDQSNFVKLLIRQGVVLEKIELIPCESWKKILFGYRKPLPPMVLYRNDSSSQSWKRTLLRIPDIKDSEW